MLNHMLKHGGITEDGLKLIKDKENLEDAEKLLRLVLSRESRTNRSLLLAVRDFISVYLI